MANRTSSLKGVYTARFRDIVLLRRLGRKKWGLAMLGSTRLAGRLTGRLAAAGAAALVAGVGVAGCTSSPASSSSATTPVTSSAPASTPAPASASAPASSAASQAAVRPSASASASQPAASPATSAGATGSTAAAACPTMDLAAHVGLAQGTAGSIYQVIYFTNLSNAPCTLFGYPGVSLAGGSPQVSQVGAAASRSTETAPTLVTIDPGQSANTTLRIVEAGNYPSGTCKPTATTFLQIFPPNQTTPIYLAYKSTGCASSAVKLLSVGVMTAGTGG
jgi:Protein of unknown function (DUF4232)